MSEKKKIIITIARQYGSGGADTGKKLAEDLGISFYDKNILRMNSDESGIKESYFHLADEKAGNRLLYKIINTLTPEKGAPSFGSDLISADNLFRFQSEVIRKLAAEESCVIIGRCADYLLRERENVIRCYIFAPYQARIRNSILTLGLATAEPQRIIEEVDKARAEYYRSHTGCEVNNTRYRDLFLNSNLLGVEGTADLIVDAVRRKFGLEAPAEEQI
mgnify:CR=1 FL=1